ncbi:hypothetical protein TBLA_0C00380 [Henningerozyma blattae CBS 6284]|uniref:USP8 dimerisation domain-containing protein n=1 Tax=Henningerozyma blattae (strain ATCC 34711 / CBS 6284 / DSM 70876 / NBRC 10599 / NRRL Y-10934 / UCD 77-7) TaxID=1071380 RepID=I2H0F2_HENB6|nr:hypothetical protein TBLA_0C00380 [Tetrapisispora blattae CBS 6284]CCH59854.1 hypothetical protein TBLA_0C00380 [Tetrapisispora blattae CBS 6284]
MMKSSKQLQSEAKDYVYNPNTSLKIYLKVCVSILDKAQNCFQSNDLQTAYIYYYRYLDLLTNKLSNHSQLKCDSSSTGEKYTSNIERQEYFQLIKLEVPAVLKIVEDLTKKIDLDYNKLQLSLAKNIATPAVTLNSVGNTLSNHSTYISEEFDEKKFNENISHFNGTYNINMIQSTESPNQLVTDDRNYPELPTLSF